MVMYAMMNVQIQQFLKKQEKSMNVFQKSSQQHKI